jgi:uncharacterized low-complexity protein
MNARWRFFAVPAVLAVAVMALSVPEVRRSTAQEGAVPASGKTPLGVRQQRVERMMDDLERKCKILAQTLQKTEPERAERIVKTLQESKQLLVQQKMANIVKLLDQSQLDDATTGQQQVLKDIRHLIALLLDEQDDRSAQEEWKQLMEWKKTIEDILDEERPQKAESDRLANKEQTLADLAAQIKAVEQLIKQQEKVNADTGEARPKGAAALGKVAGQQAKVREATEKTADMIAGKKPGEGEAKPGEGKPGEGKPVEGKPGEGKPGEAKPNEGKPGEGKPKEGKPGEGKPGEGKPKEGKPGEGKPGEGKPSEGKPGEGKPGEGKPGEGKPGEGQPGEGQPGEEKPKENKQPPAPGEKSLRDAAKNQQSAEKNLGDGKGKASEEDEQRALADLKKALDQLKKEENRIASLPPEEFKKLADKQADTANKTAKLEDQMKKQEEGGGGEGGEGGKPGKPGAGKKGKPSPGKKSVQQAKKNMDDASEDLGKQDPAEASRDQDKSIKELEKALQEIEDRLAQLREETQLEKLARLEKRFREMLAMQQAATKETIDLDKKRVDGELARPDRLAVQKLGADERAIAELAQQAYDIIYEDGTSVVFPEIVGQLRDDLVAVGQLLDTLKTDTYTQSSQTEIEITLKELIEALQKAQQQKESPPGEGKGGSGGGEEPLLPNSAELKLLRLSQLRVNRRTESFDKARPATDLEPVLKQEVMNISQRQSEIAEMTIRILERASR